jgi:hypothetical protein
MFIKNKSMNDRTKKILTRASVILVLSGFAGCDFWGGKGWGTLIKFDAGELYYTSTIEAREAYKLGEYLVDSGFFDENRKTVQINKTDETYEFRMIVKKGIEQDPDFIDIFKDFSRELSYYVFDEASVDMHLCDEYFNTLRVVIPL